MGIAPLADDNRRGQGGPCLVRLHQVQFLAKGGNPLLEGVWFFGNGMICFKTSYDFFMIALDGQEDVEKMVKEIKGLLPQAA